ncbi:glutaredoxin [Salinicola endophyticus]|uniref:Glutaredoxin n=2 Tax=Halomonadaceae TaxID=28256 RepID=A0ABY8FKA5_9GAMM|nr:glutaredoxin [Salinicola endophyticus]
MGKKMFEWIRRRLQPMSATITRSAEDQAAVDEAAAQLALYHFQRCPFCVRVRHQIERLGVPIELRDIQRDPDHRRDLIAGGGRGMVPCLRIVHDDGQVEWMYESADINRYLEQRFGG